MAKKKRQYNDNIKQDKSTDILSNMSKTKWNSFGNAYSEFYSSRVFCPNDARVYLANPLSNEVGLRRLSLYLLQNSPIYSKIINYLSSLLTLDYILIPTGKQSKEEKKENMTRVHNYIKKYNLKTDILDIIKILLVEDIYFGIETEDKSNVMICRIPPEYCQIIGKTENTNIFLLSCQFFEDNPHYLSILDARIVSKYKECQKKNIPSFEIDISMGGVCFKLQNEFRYAIPLFSSLFEDLLTLEHKKDELNAQPLFDNFKLLIQEVPLGKNSRNESDLIFPSDFVKDCHTILKGAVPKNVSVVTTPMQVNPVSLVNKNENEQEKIIGYQKFLLDSSGVGKFLSNDIKTDKALEMANISEEVVLFKLLRQIEQYFNIRVRNVLKLDNIKIKFLDVTHTNRENVVAHYLKLAQFGYPKSLVAVASGLSQEEFYGLNEFENEFDFTEQLVPLNSSHTKSLKDKAEEKKLEEEIDTATEETNNETGFKYPQYEDIKKET